MSVSILTLVATARAQLSHAGDRGLRWVTKLWGARFRCLPDLGCCAHVTCTCRLQYGPWPRHCSSATAWRGLGQSRTEQPRWCVASDTVLPTSVNLFLRQLAQPLCAKDESSQVKQSRSVPRWPSCTLSCVTHRPTYLLAHLPVAQARFVVLLRDLRKYEGFPRCYGPMDAMAFLGAIDPMDAMGWMPWGTRRALVMV